MRSFKERKIDAIFALPCDSDIKIDFPTIQYKVTGMPAPARAFWEQIIWRQIVKKHKPDILYSSANFGLLRPPIPQVLLIREGGLFDPFYLRHIGPSLGPIAIFERKLRRRLILASAKSSSLVLTPTQSLAELLNDWDGTLQGRVFTNLYGTALDKFVKHARRRWRVDGVLKILLVSAYYSHKQPGLIAEAVRKLNEAGISTHFTLTMDFDQILSARGGTKDYLILQKGVDRGEVTMLGRVDYERLPALYRDHDIFVTASISETFGHPLAEAMASEIPLIAADTPVHKEVCKSAAIYFNSVSSESLVKKIKLLDSNPKFREQLTKTGLHFGKTRYDWNMHVDRLLSFFSEICQRSSR